MLSFLPRPYGVRGQQVALFTLHQRGQKRLAFHGFLRQALTNDHRLHAASLGTRTDKIAIRIA